MKRIILLLTVVLCPQFFLLQVFSKTDSDDSQIVITASRSWNSVAKEGKSITVVTEEDIKNSGKKTLADVLESVPGVIITRNGADGGLTNVYLRGGSRANVLIMVDGVRISDPMGIDKKCDISGIGVSSVERVEIVRGAMSSMYGADASGGVINIITKGAAKGVSLSGEAGSGRTFNGVLSAGTGSSFFSFSHSYANAISKAKQKSGEAPFDKDAYSNTAVSGRVKADISETASLNFVMNYTDSRADIDDGPSKDDPNRIYSTKLFTSKGEFSHSLFDWWTYRAGASCMFSERDDHDLADDLEPNSYVSLFRGSNMSAELISVFSLFNIDRVTIGFELLNEKGSSESYSVPPNMWDSKTEEKSVLTRSAFLHNALSIGVWSLNSGVRLDSHELFGSHTSWDASSSVSVPFTGTVFRVSAGTGFRAPSLDELYAVDYGNKDLKPEESLTYDAGIYQEFFKGFLSVDCSLFRNKYKNIIYYDIKDPNTFEGMYENGGKTSSTGLEATVILKPVDFLTLTYGFTTLRFPHSAAPVLKRPRNTHTASALVSFRGLNVMLMYLHAGARIDYGTQRLAPYHKLDLNARYSVNENFGISFRCLNITDADYEESYGYNTRGRSFYGGAELKI
ncbi:MAG: TonB-dependent receptor [Leptospirales bacterium]|nr:TonB-dependent receptor [Leptospirales bacterium]